MTLPDGNYIGRVDITPATFENNQSLDYGRMKFVFEIVITEGEFKDISVLHDRVISPHYLANSKAPDENETDTWLARDVNQYLRQTNNILGKCGVEVSEKNLSRLVQSIAESNLRQPIVSFTIIDGIPQIERFLRFENNEKYLNQDIALPDGNDAPL